MTHLMISNKGEAEVGAFTLIGASSKRGDASKIGMFGSGAKLALAVLLRDNLPPMIYSGLKEYHLSLEEESFRGDTYQRLNLKVGTTLHRTSITTQAGHTWGVKEALRDIISNALDEDSSPRIKMVASPAKKAGETRIFIPHSSEVEDFYRNLEYYFTFQREPVLSKEDGDLSFHLYPKVRDGETILYRKGVQCYTSREHSLYDYDLPSLDVGEDRRASLYSVRSTLPRLFNHLPLSYKKKILSYVSDNYRMGINTLESDTNPRWDFTSPDWVEATDGRVIMTKLQASLLREEIGIIPHYILPDTWAEELWQRGAKNPQDLFDSTLLKGFTLVTPLPWEEESLARVTAFLSTLGYNISCPVCLFSSEDGIVLGEYDPKDDRILLNRKIFEEYSLKKVSSILLEEYAHRESKSPDKSRSLQDWCFNEIIRLGLEMKGKGSLL